MFLRLLLVLAGLTAALHAQLKVTTGHSPVDASFKLDPVPPPATNDAASNAVFTVIDGEPDPNSGSLDVLSDGAIPTGEDQPKANFFFRAGRNGGRLRIDLGAPVAIKTVATYSWHPGARASQTYRLYGSDGTAPDFNDAPKRDTDPLTCGWKPVAKADTRSKPGGQHAVEITNSRFDGLGSYRYLLFDIEQTDPADSNSNTFFSEIDVIDAKGTKIERIEPGQKIIKNFKSPDGKFEYVLDSTNAPDLARWSEKELMPEVLEWYPKLVEMLPSPRYKAPETVILRYLPDTEMKGTPAWAAGNQVSMNADWYRRQLDNEAKGCTIHELVHVVQNYWRARMTNSNPKPNPGWLVEGICDYIRFFLYEPKIRGAHIGPDRASKVNYDGSYRITGNFLNWVVQNHDKEIIQKINAACRHGDYSDDLWEKFTGKDLETLNTDWKKALERGR